MNGNRITDRGILGTSRWLESLSREELEGQMLRIMKAYESLIELSQMRVNSRASISDYLYQELDEVKKVRDRYIDSQRRAAEAKHAASPAGVAKKLIKKEWRGWQASKDMYESKLKFYEAMHTKHGFPTDVEVLYRWIRAWEKELN